MLAALLFILSSCMSLDCMIFTHFLSVIALRVSGKKDFGSLIISFFVTAVVFLLCVEEEKQWRQSVVVELVILLPYCSGNKSTPSEAAGTAHVVCSKAQQKSKLHKLILSEDAAVLKGREWPNSCLNYLRKNHCRNTIRVDEKYLSCLFYSGGQKIVVYTNIVVNEAN